MNLFRRMAVIVGFVLTIFAPITVPAQQLSNAGDDTVLKQIIVFGRHSVRSSSVDQSILAQFAVDPYPAFEVQAGYLTPHGRQAELLLGSYYRQYLLHEKLLTGNARTDLAHSYFRANSIQRSNITAQAFQTALIPGSKMSVHSYPLGKADPVFDPIAAGVAKVNPDRAVAEVRAMFNSGEALASAYSGEYALVRSALFDYPLGMQPPPGAPPGLVDPTALGISLTVNTKDVKVGTVVDIGGLMAVLVAVDPFVMQYTDGLPQEQVAWGRLTLDQLSQQTRLINLYFDIAMRSPYLDRVQSSNAASHVLRTMEQTIKGRRVPGAFGNAKSNVVVVISSDNYVTGLAGLLNAHWQLPGYQRDFCAPGGALVFELRQSRRSKEYIVRVFYTAQTFDQLRNLTPLTLEEPPATIQLLIPGGSKSPRNQDVKFEVFQKLMEDAIGCNHVEAPWKEAPPGVLTDVPTE